MLFPPRRANIHYPLNDTKEKKYGASNRDNKLPSAHSTEADLQQQALRNEMQLAAEMVRRCIEENALKAQDQTEYLRQYEQYAQRYETLKNEYEALLALRQKKKENQDRLSQFIAMLQNQTALPVKFHEDLWLATVDKITVHPYHVVFTFRAGFEITEDL